MLSPQDHDWGEGRKEHYAAQGEVIAGSESSPTGKEEHSSGPHQQGSCVPKTQGGLIVAVRFAATPAKGCIHWDGIGPDALCLSYLPPTLTLLCNKSPSCLHVFVCV